VQAIDAAATGGVEGVTRTKVFTFSAESAMSTTNPFEYHHPQRAKPRPSGHLPCDRYNNFPILFLDRLGPEPLARLRDRRLSCHTRLLRADPHCSIEQPPQHLPTDHPDE
jgi:hypothetical protein